MPYDVFRRGSRWCVYRVDEDGQATGRTLGCHDTQDEARQQVAALYANEKRAAVLLKRLEKLEDWLR